MPQYFSDNFSAFGNGDTLGSRNTWAPIPGVTGGMVIVDGAVRNTGTSGSAAYYAVDSLASSPNCAVTADVFNGNGHPGICLRVDPATNSFYHARVDAGTIQLYKFVNGSATLLGSWNSGFTGYGNRSFKLRLVTENTSIKVFVNDDPTARISVTDSSIAGPGYCGVRTNSPGTSVFGTVDNVMAETLGAVVTPVTLSLFTAQIQATRPVPTLSQGRNLTLQTAQVDTAANTLGRSQANNLSLIPVELPLTGGTPWLAQAVNMTLQPAVVNWTGYPPSVLHDAGQTENPVVPVTLNLAPAVINTSYPTLLRSQGNSLTLEPLSLSIAAPTPIRRQANNLRLQAAVVQAGYGGVGVYHVRKVSLKIDSSGKLRSYNGKLHLNF